MSNIILNTDSYKASHFNQYPQGTNYVHSYVEARGSTYKFIDEVTFFGLQIFIQNILTKPITFDNINEAEIIFNAHGEPFNREGWEYILKQHSGYLPVIIKALPEGSTVRVGTPLVTVENTDPNVPWLTSYLETAILRAVWYPTTVCTISREAKKVIAKYLNETSDTSEGLAFKLHDFGSRGVSSDESAGIGGLAHLVNFMGSDTITALMYARKYYDAEMVGFSIPASEHSTITSWGRENETAAYSNMIDQFGHGLFACVSDSYNIYDAISNKWGNELKEKVLSMDGTLVVRPDSGNPIEVVPKCLKLLDEAFGSTINSKGYKVLSEKVRLIQGDGISLDSIPKILDVVKREGFSTDNIVMGMGGALLQHCDRDTFKFAMKCSAIEIDGKWNDVYKDPIHGGKTSKRGKQDTALEMQTVFKDGKAVNFITLDQIRLNASL